MPRHPGHKNRVKVVLKAEYSFSIIFFRFLHKLRRHHEAVWKSGKEARAHQVYSVSKIESEIFKRYTATWPPNTAGPGHW